MTDHDAPSGANEPGCPLAPTGLWVRAQVRQSRRHRDGLLLALEPLDPHRPGRLSAVLSGTFLRQIEAARASCSTRTTSWASTPCCSPWWSIRCSA